MIQSRKEIEKLTPYIPGKPIDEVKHEFGLEDVIKLASNENPLGCSRNAIDAVIESLQAPSLYPNGNCTEVREALSKKYSILPEELAFGCGADELIALIAKAFISKGEEAITCTPSFSQYKAGVVAMGGEMVEVPLIDFTFDLDGILSHINEKTKMIFICNPNNPTGTIVSKEQQLDFMNKVPSHILVVWDEAYREYTTAEEFPDTLSIIKKFENILLLKTFSKIYGLASMRIGYAIASKYIVECINRIRSPFNVTTQAQVAALASLKDEAFLAYSRESNEASKLYSYERCKELGLDYIRSHANFIMVDCKLDSLDLFDKLQQKGVIVRPGFYFGMPTYQRITLGTLEQMKTCFDLIAQFI